MALIQLNSGDWYEEANLPIRNGQRYDPTSTSERDPESGMSLSALAQQQSIQQNAAQVAALTPAQSAIRAQSLSSMAGLPLKRTDSASSTAGGPTGAGKGKVIVRNADGTSKTYALAENSTNGLDAALKAGGKIMDPLTGKPMSVVNAYGGWLANGIPLNVVAGEGWKPAQKEVVSNLFNTGWRPGKELPKNLPGLPLEALKAYKGLAGNESLKPTNLRLISPDGERWDGYDYNQIQQKLDQGWGVMEGDQTLGSDRVKRFGGGWLIDDRPVNTVVSGLIDPAQRKALSDAGIWHPEWDDPNNPNYISQVGLNDPRHSWTTPGKMWNPETGAFDDYAGPAAGNQFGDYYADQAGAPSEWDDDFGELAKGWNVPFNYPRLPLNVVAKPFDEKFSFSPEEIYGDPSYLFRFAEGQRATQAAQSAGMRQYGGRALKELTRYGQGMASQEYADTYARKLQEFRDRFQIETSNKERLSNEFQKGYGRDVGEYGMAHDIFTGNQDRLYNRLAGLSGTGQTATTTAGQLGGNYGANAGNTMLSNARSLADIYGSAANARAAGRVGSGNAWTGAFGKIADDVADIYTNRWN